jgi:hypothetical protein
MNGYVMVHLREPRNFIRVDGRRLARHGLHANLHMLPAELALRLIDARIVRLAKHMSLSRLRRETAENAATPMQPQPDGLPGCAA